MRFQLDSNYILAALGLAGVGAPVIWPEAKWIGVLFMVLAGIVFVFGIRLEGLQIRRSRPHLGKAKLNFYVAMMIASLLVFASAVAGYFGLFDGDRGREKPPVGHAQPPSQPPAEQPAPQSKREFTNKTIRQLRALFEGRTALQGDALIKPFKGLWVETEGEIVLINTNPAVVLKMGEQDSVECWFSKDWSNVLARYSNGEKLKVRGQINDTQNGAQLYLKNCEVVGVDP